jgi:hypothetical protein
MGVTHVVLIGTLAVAGSQGFSRKPESAQPQVPATELVPLGKSPYNGIFRAPVQDPSLRNRVVPVPQNKTAEMRPRIVCGMVVIPVKPDADPRMVVQAPKDDRPREYKIKKIVPRLCNE